MDCAFTIIELSGETFAVLRSRKNAVDLARNQRNVTRVVRMLLRSRCASNSPVLSLVRRPARKPAHRPLSGQRGRPHAVREGITMQRRSEPANAWSACQWARFSGKATICESMKTAAARVCEQGLHGAPCLLCHRVIVKRACVGGCAVQEHHDDAGEPFRLSACEAVAQDLFEEP